MVTTASNVMTTVQLISKQFDGEMVEEEKKRER
jgi:hypothetical protein